MSFLEKNKIGIGSLAVVLLSIFSTLSHAQTDSGGETSLPSFGLVLNLETLHDQNAARVRDSAGIEKLKEVQNRYTADVKLGIDRDNFTVNSSYNFARNQFIKGSQDDTNTRIGDVSVRIGDDKSPYDVEIAHSARRVLNNPQDQLIITNTRKQDTLTVTPALRSNSNKPLVFEASAIFNKIEFENESLDNSEAFGGQIEVIGNLSKTRRVSLIGSQRETDFDGSEEGDYEYLASALEYSVTNRVSAYAVSLGYNKAQPTIGDDSEGVFYSVSAQYSDYGHQVAVTTNRQISDSSAANGIDITDTQITAGSPGNLRDQLQVINHTLVYSNSTICLRCDFSLSYSEQRLNYETLIQENVTNRVISGRFAYKLNRKLSFSMVLNRQDADFESELPQRDSENLLQTYQLDYLYGPNFSTRFYYSRIDRDESANPYGTHIFGLNFSLTVK